MTELRRTINPEIDLSIKKLSVHKAMSGCRIIRITGEQAEPQADLLINRINEKVGKYGDNVSVYKPGLGSKNQMYFEANGSDDTLTEEKVRQQLLAVAEGNSKNIRVDRFSYTNRGWRIRFACTRNIGNKLLSRGFLKVGWSRVRVRLMPRARLRCYKCLKTGHVISSCQEETDRGRRCFNCGNAGHGDRCANETRCPLCLDLRQESMHKLGSFNCTYPTFPTRREVSNNNRYSRYDNDYNDFNTARLGGEAYDSRRSFAEPNRRSISESDSNYYD